MKQLLSGATSNVYAGTYGLRRPHSGENHACLTQQSARFGNMKVLGECQSTANFEGASLSLALEVLFCSVMRKSMLYPADKGMGKNIRGGKTFKGPC